jgi:hypothetical protein
VETLVSADEGFLSHVLGVLVVAHDAVRHPHRQPAAIGQPRLEFAREVRGGLVSAQNGAGQPLRELMHPNSLYKTTPTAGRLEEFFGAG